MNNEIREKDHEWVKMFHSNIDRLLVSIEKLFESRQQKMSVKLHIQRKSYYLCNNILRGKCKFILELRT